MYTWFRMNILDLPPNVTLLIFSYLNQRDIVRGVRQTCTPWCLLSYERMLWRTINLSKFRDASFTSKSFIQLLSSVANSVECLYLDLHQLNKHGLVHNGVVCPNLKKLYFYTSRSSKLEQKNYTGRFPNLEPFSESTVLQLCLQELSEKYSGLKSLHLLSHVVSIEYLQNIFPELEEIEIECCNLSASKSNEWVQNFVEMHRCIKKISIRYSVISSEPLSVIFREVPDICHLDLSNSSFSHDIDTDISFKSLEKLILDNTRCDDTMLGIIVKDAVNLKYISIGDCTNVTNNGLDHLADNCPNLETLIINEFEYSQSNITDSGLQKMANSSRKLKVLKVNFCSGISDIGVQAIAESCPDLRRIEIAGCTALTDASVISLIQNCPMLQVLNLGHCVQLTSKCTNFILQHCKCLVYLNLETCHRIAGVRFEEEYVHALNFFASDKVVSSFSQASLDDSANSAADQIQRDSTPDESSADSIQRDTTAADDGTTGTGAADQIQRDATLDNSSANQIRRNSTSSLDDSSANQIRRNSTVSLDDSSNVVADHTQRDFTASLDDSANDIADHMQRVSAAAGAISVLETLSVHSHVQTLILRFCSQLSNSCVRQISRVCPDLRKLDLCGCSMVTNAGIREVVRNCQFLHTLIISGGSVFQTSRLTDACLESIAEHCKYIESLVIVKNHNITIDGVFKVIKKCPLIAHISVEVSKRANIKPECMTKLASEFDGKLVCAKYVGSNTDINIFHNVERRMVSKKTTAKC